MTETVEAPERISSYGGPDLILSIDPGKRTGLALYRVSTGELAVYEMEWVPACATIDAWCAELKDQLAVVIERFTITIETAKNTAAPWSMEMIGVARYHAAKNRCLFELSAQSTAKRFSTDQQLKELGWWRPGQGHGNDALKHLLLFLVTRSWWDNRLIID